ncbi:MAG TPA: septum formation initiator family protein [Xanthobacteraceae bacterium]|nr:septum formation initiator family protein [Xanthobacteraceae bacterium]
MVTRKRLRSFFTAMCLYVAAGLFIGYFAVNAFSGNRGLRAQQALEEQIAYLNGQLDRAKSERVHWEKRVALLRSDRIDPDLLDELARSELEYVDPRDVTLLLQRP